MRRAKSSPMQLPCAHKGAHVLALLLLTVASTSGFGAQQTAAAAPKPLVEKPVPDVSKEALVFDQMLTRIRLEGDGTGARETTVRVRVLADAGVKAMAVLAFTYTASNQQVDIAYVRVKKPDGTVVVTPDYNAQDLPADVTREAPMYSDVREKHVAVRGLGVGDTLEYQVTQRTLKPEVPGQFWLDYGFQKTLICLDEQLDLDVPADKAVTVASADTQPIVTTVNGRKLYHWASSNLVRPDPDAPPKSTKHQKPSVQVTTFANWQQIGNWYQSLQKDAVAVTPSIQARADALTKGLTTDEDKLRAIFNEVALHIHYVGLDFGIGRYQPHSADDVLANEYGDCKDKYTLLAALLKAEGIEAWPVLIGSGRDLDPDTPSPGQFDHVITVVPLKGKLLWMDATEELAPIGALMNALRDKQALAVPVAKNPYLERTPTELPYVQSAVIEVKGKLSEQGVFTAHFDQSYHGDVEMVMRAAFRAVPQSQWKQMVQNFSNVTGFAGDVEPPQVSPVEQTGEPFHIAYDYRREKYGDWDNRRISPPMPPVGWELGPGVKQTKPLEDIELDAPADQVYRSTVVLPRGWALFPQSNVDVKEDWAEYHATYAFKDGVYTAERRLMMKKNKVPLADWDKYLAFRRAVYDDEVRMTPLMQQNAAGGATINLSGGEYWRTDAVRTKMGELLDPLKEAVTTLSAAPMPDMSKIMRAKETCSALVATAEAASMDLAQSDAHSLYYAQALTVAWTCRGWAEMETKNLGAAEVYLRPAWRVSQSRIAGYELARALEDEGKKAEAAHMYEKAHLGMADNMVGAALPPDFDLDARIAEGYKRVTGKDLAATGLKGGQYTGSLRAELDGEQEIRPFTRATKLTGSGLYSLAFEAGKPVKAVLLNGDPGFGSMEPVLAAHAFPPELPAGSKARVLREVRLICTPWAGCDAYLLLPTAIELPSQIIRVPAGTLPKTMNVDGEQVKVIEIKKQP